MRNLKQLLDLGHPDRKWPSQEQTSHFKAKAHAIDLYTISVLFLLVTELGSEEIRTEPQVFLVIKPMFLSPTQHSYLNTITGPAAPTPTNNTIYKFYYRP